jgi:protein gp37/ParB-like chromosome segregation protein Spo0J
MIETISIKLLDPHPDNPRLQLREEVIDAIQAQIHEHGYEEMHAIIVRKLGKRYQILDGHHRADAAEREGLKAIPAWVCEYTDEEAFMQLVLANAQSGLTPLERGKHAVLATTRYGTNGKDSITKYAYRVLGVQDGQEAEKQAARVQVARQIYAYEVFAEVNHVVRPDQYFRQFAEIHAADRPFWKELAERMIDEGWTVEHTRAEVKRVQPPKQVKIKAKPQVTSVALTDWEQMSKEQQADILNWRGRGYTYRINEQKTDNVEWARGSTNPITGCRHNCPYCYAREIAERIYPEKFEPVLHLDRLIAPYTTPVPAMAQQDMSYRNVFMCSMADMFGQWVPTEWIETILETVRENPQWNFLFLTKFPIRMAEFEYPDNAWLGTTVDLQARVKNAERAMRKVKAKVKWLSLEPLLESLQFEDLSTFNWIVIGGASPIREASTGPTPEWRPPRRWVWDLTGKALDAGCLVYHKTNLNNERLKMFPNDPNPLQIEPGAAPSVFKYLKVIA